MPILIHNLTFMRANSPLITLILLLASDLRCVSGSFSISSSGYDDWCTEIYYNYIYVALLVSLNKF